jgi:hypothetical protein
VLQTSKQHLGSKPPHLLELRDAYTQVIQTHLVASNNHAGINGGWKSYASTIKGKDPATGGLFIRYHDIETLKFQIPLWKQ